MLEAINPDFFRMLRIFNMIRVIYVVVYVNLHLNRLVYLVKVTHAGVWMS